MDLDPFCFFCGSEMDFDLDDAYAKCVAMSCGAYFHLEVEKGCVRGLKVITCGKECTCVKNDS